MIHIALPVMDEPEALPFLIDCLTRQNFHNFRLVACVNQPEIWWEDPRKRHACLHNADSLELLRKISGFQVELIDHSSRGLGWKGKKLGVGYARKAVIDHILQSSERDDLIISMDADTTFPDNYLRSVAETFRRENNMVALAVPYYHKLTGDPDADRAILRYEIYMRHYLLNLGLIGSPYAFTALGSAMAARVSAVRAIGGMTPKLSGEDFYFLQKLRKFGQVGLWNDETVNPATRFSDRVFFGTGPAMIKGAEGDWLSYPIYPQHLFKNLEETYKAIPQYFQTTGFNDVVRFMSEIFREEDPFQPIRSNHVDLAHFTRGFHEKLDGLRILQYLKTHHDPTRDSDEKNFRDFLERYFPFTKNKLTPLFDHDFSFETASTALLSGIRDFLFDREMVFRATSALR